MMVTERVMIIIDSRRSLERSQKYLSCLLTFILTLSRSIGATVHSVFIISHTAEQLQGSGKLKYADISILDGIKLAFLKLSSLI